MSRRNLLATLVISLALIVTFEVISAAIPVESAPAQPNQNVGGTIISNTTWFSTTTYNVVNNVGIAPGVVLTIQAGTVIKFNGNYSLTVGGTLIADGTSVQPIRFTPNVTGTTWGRIYFDNPSVDAVTDMSGTYQSGNLLRWVTIDGAASGIGCNSATPYLEYVTVGSGDLNCVAGITPLWVKTDAVTGGAALAFNPVLGMAAFSASSNWTDVAVAGNYAYVGDGSDLRIVSVADPARPTLSSTLTIGSAQGVAVSGTYAYVADYYTGLHIINVSNPITPVEVSSIAPCGGRSDAVAVQGNYVYMTQFFSNNWLCVFNVADPVHPTLAGVAPASIWWANVMVSDIKIMGTYAYLAAGQAGGMRVIDITNPNLPVEVGASPSVDQAIGVDVADRYVYLANRWGGLQIIDVVTPTQPVEVGRMTSGIAEARDVAVDDSVAYIPDQNFCSNTLCGTWLIDVADPRQPETVNRYNAMGEAVATANGLAYVVNYDGLRIMRLNPFNVRLTDSTLLGDVILPIASQVTTSTLGGDVTSGGYSTIDHATIDGNVNINETAQVRHSSLKNLTINAAAVAQENHLIGGNLTVGAGASVLSNTIGGGGVIVGNGSVVQGNSVTAAPGWGLTASGIVTVTRNRIVSTANGLQVSGYVQGNLIAYTSGVGAQVNDGVVLSNTLIGNQGNTLVVSGTIQVQGNNLEFNTGAYDLVNNSSNPIDAANNWWGTTDTAIIDARVYDFLDDYNLGQVNYTPVLTQPASDAPAYARAITLTPASPIGLETAAFDVQFSRAMDLSRPPTITFYSMRKNTWQAFNSSNSGLANNYVNAIAVDAAGNQWFGTTYGGVSVLRAGNTWQTYNTTNSGLAGNAVYAVAVDAVGDKWFGTSFNGVSVLRANGAWQTYATTDSGVPLNGVRVIVVDATGNKWFGTNNGINVLHVDGTWQTYSTTNSGLASNYVSAISLDAVGNKWIGTNNGVSVLHADGTWQTYTTANSGLGSNIINASAVDPIGNIWFGTNAGAGMFRNDGMWHSELTSGYILAVATDAAGNIWFGADSGASVKHGDGSWQAYTTANSGLLSNQVTGITTDATGDVWFGTNGGASALYGGTEYTVTANPQWLAPDHYRASYDFSALVPDDDYTVTVASASGSDGIEIAPHSAFTFTLAYTGTFDTTPPPAPIVRACASPLTTTLSAQWTTPTTLMLNLYRYAIGTAPDQNDVVDWTDTALNSIMRTDLNLNASQTYYVSIKARSVAGVWGAVGASNSVIAGAGGCPQIDFTATPTTGMSPLSVAFTSIITDPITAQTWSFGDGITTTDTAPTHIYAPGVYTVTLDVIGPGGWSTLIKPAYIDVVPDAVPPTGAITVAQGAEFSAMPLVSVDVTALDPSGLDALRLSNDGLTYADWLSYTTALSWTLSSGDGPKTVYAQVRDVPGNIATFADTIILDTTPPTVTVTPLPTFSGEATITVTWSGYDTYAGLDTYDVQLRDGAGGTWTDWLTNTSQTSATFTGLDAHTYYFRVRARDMLGNLSVYAMGDGDTHTTLDLRPPIGQVMINNGAPYAGSVSVTLTLTATDLSGVDALAISNDGITYAGWISDTNAYSWTLSSGDGLKTIYTRFRDHVGHTSGPVTDTIVLYSEAPTGSLSIDADAWATSSPTVTLTIIATDGLGLADLCVANETEVCSAWESFITSRAWQLLPTDGVHTVTVSLRNLAGNVTSMDDGIVLDTTSPTVTLAALTTYQTSPSFDVGWSGADATTGVADFDVQVRDGAGDWTDWITRTLSLTATFSGSDGYSYSFHSRATDRVNNVSQWSVPVTTTVDTTAPSSAVNALLAIEMLTTFPITWTGSDATSGIAAYDLQVRDGLSGEWATWLTRTTSTTALFAGVADHTYYFRSRAIDRAGNVEAWPSDPNGDTLTLIKLDYRVYLPLVQR